MQIGRQNIYVCVYVYTHIYMYIYTCVYTHIHACTCIKWLIYSLWLIYISYMINYCVYMTNVLLVLSRCWNHVNFSHWTGLDNFFPIASHWLTLKLIYCILLIQGRELWVFVFWILFLDITKMFHLLDFEVETGKHYLYLVWVHFYSIGIYFKERGGRERKRKHNEEEEKEE